MDQLTRAKIFLVLAWWLNIVHVIQSHFLLCCVASILHKRQLRNRSYTLNFYANRAHLKNLVYASDTTCFEQLRLNRLTFDKLCAMLDTLGGLKPTKNMLVDEQVAMFLHILAHHVKNRVIKFRFGRSGETVSRYFNLVLTALIRLQGELFKTPQPVPENSRDEKWKWFKNCLGALDGTHIRVKVPMEDKAKYRNRKGDITTNVLGVCSQDLQFIYVLPGWEGSAADGRVLRDAIDRRNGFRVPHGHYYLVDAGYANAEGFLAPFRKQRYHLNDWTPNNLPRTPEEFFNMKHSHARNAIEKCFGFLKMRWAILRSPSYYPVRTHNRVIIACCLLHNLIRREMVGVDPLEVEINNMQTMEVANNEDDDPILTIEATDEWTAWRANLANQMFNEWRAQRYGG